MNSEMEYKLNNTADALEIMLKELHQIGSTAWLGYFKKMSSCLSKRDIECAVRARDSIPFSSAGGFGEYLEQNPSLNKPYNDLQKTIGNLKVFYRFQINRDLVKL